MSFLKQILKPFVEFSDDKKTEPANQKNAPKVENKNATPDDNPSIPFTTNASINAPLQHYTPLPGMVNSGVFPEHEKHFDNLIEEANAKNPLFQGTDYKEFVDSKIDLDAIPDEATKYKTAFNVLKSTGLTKEKLISTGQEYINIIGRDLNAFQGAHSQQYQKEVKQKELLIQKKAEELKALNEKIAALNAEIKQISQEATQTKDQLNLIRNSFLMAGEHKQREIYNELQKINQYF
jgi:methionine aminopeptidase